MAPTLLNAVTVLLAWTGGASAKSFQLSETIDKDNFYDKFSFMTVGELTLPVKLRQMLTTDDQKGRGSSEFDDNDSYVKYQDLEDARDKNITRIQSNGDIYLGVDHTNVLDPEVDGGRDTFRVESQRSYHHGLFIARFTHMPRAVCGSWPAL